jgi:hypothetical protein
MASEDNDFDLDLGGFADRDEVDHNGAHAVTLAVAREFHQPSALAVPATAAL